MAGTDASVGRGRDLRDVARSGDASAGELPVTHGNRVEVLEGIPEFIPRLLTDIRAAREQVNVSMYALHPGPPGGVADAVVGALIERADAGVPVTVQLDQLGSKLARPGAENPLVDRMRAHGVEVRIKGLTPGRAGLNDARFAVDHRKVIEIDGRVSYQGGINLVDAWSEWQDLMTRVEGPSSAQAGAMLAARWHDLGGTVTERRIDVLERGLATPVADAHAGVRQLSNGNRDRRELTEAYLELVRGATQSIRVANPYLSDPEVMGALVEAARRGVDVELHLPPKAGELADLLTDPFRRAWAAKLHEAGARVVQLPEFSHAKALIADDQVLVGSFNLDAGAARRNYESAIVTNDPQVRARMTEIFDRQRASGEQLEDVPGTWKALAWLRDALNLSY